MLPTIPTLTIDDAVMAVVATNEAADLAGQELSHAHLTTLVERMGWRPTDSQKFTNTPKGLVSKWLLERGIPMHPRTRRVKFDDLVAAAATPGKLQPTSPQRLERRAMEAQTKMTHRIAGLSDAINRAERILKATERGYELLVENLERMRVELQAAQAEEQRLYDEGDRVNTFSRLDLTLPGGGV